MVAIERQRVLSNHILSWANTVSTECIVWGPIGGDHVFEVELNEGFDRVNVFGEGSLESYGLKLYYCEIQVEDDGELKLVLGVSDR